MIAPREYKTPQAFKVALEDRIKKRAATAGVAVNRVRQRFVMERFLARISHEFGTSIVLKGGLALELRLSKARSTKDIDLHAHGDPDAIYTRLRRAGLVDLADRLRYQVEPDPEHPDIDDAVYEGRRLRVFATIASQPYGSPFGVDVGIGDVVHGTSDTLTGEDFLDFIGVSPAIVPAYPVETHVAEKLHAYTRRFPAGRVNSRVRDLPDMALLATVKDFEADVLRAAITATFTTRGTHPLPVEFPDPPSSWAALYRALADEHDLPWKDVLHVTAAVTAFIAPILGEARGRWNRVAWSWKHVGT